MLATSLRSGPHSILSSVTDQNELLSSTGTSIYREYITLAPELYAKSRYALNLVKPVLSAVLDLVT